MSLSNYNRSQHGQWTKDAGSRSATNGLIDWVGRFIKISHGSDAEHFSSGYSDINPLPANFDVPILATYNNPSPGVRTTNASGAIQLNAWETLCYQFVPGSNNTTVNSRFFITASYGNHFHSNEFTFPVCHRGNDKLLWIDGVYTDLDGNAVEDTQAVQADFWRQGTPNNLIEFPEGAQTDETMSIRRRGKVGIGNSFQNGGGSQAWNPTAYLDVNGNNARTGTYGGDTETPLYVTGNIPPIGADNATIPDGSIIQFGHWNQTARIGIGYDGIAAMGTGNRTLNFKAQGSGSTNGYFTFTYPTGSQYTTNHYARGGAAQTGWSYTDQYSMNGTLVGQRRIVISQGSPLATEHRWIHRTWSGGWVNGMRLEPDRNETGASALSVGENVHGRKKLTLFNNSSTNANQFMGIGTQSTGTGGAAVTYQSYANYRHNFYHAQNATTTDLLFTIKNEGAVGRVGINNMPNPSTQLDVNGGAIIGVHGTTRENYANDDILNAFTAVQVPAAATADTEAIRFGMPGIPGVSWSNLASWRVGKTTAGINASTRVSLWTTWGGSNTPNLELFRTSVAQALWTRSLPNYANEGAAITAGRVAGDYYTITNPGVGKFVCQV